MSRPRLSRLGKRGEVLVVFGVLWLVIGLGVLVNPRDISPTLLHAQLPIPARIGLWWLAGLLAIVTATRERWQWIGYTALILPPAIRALSYVLSVVFNLPDSPITIAGTPADPTLIPGRLQLLALYLGMVAALYRFASWPEPSTTTPEAGDHARD